MRRLSVLVVLIGVLVGALAFSAPAQAQTALDPGRCSAPDGPSGGTGLGGAGSVGSGAGGGGGGSWGGGGAAAPTASTTSTTMVDGEGGDCSSLLDQIAPGPDPGTYPSSHYDIGYDQGGNCVCSSRRITGWATAFMFSIAQWVVRIGLGIINWVLNFAPARLLMGQAQRVADAYQNQVIARTGLAPFFLFLCALWGGFLAFTGRIGRGFAELGTSLLILAFAASFWSNPGRSLTGGLDFVAGVSGEVAAVTTGADVDSPTSSNAVGASMARAIHKTFIENTHMIINWGRVIPAGDQCRAVYDAAVASGPWGTSSKPRVAMKEAGCTAEDKFNRDPSMGRLLSALLVMLASVLLIVMLVMVSYTLIKSQIEVLVALVVWPFALLSGTLPGHGRSLFWRWIGSTAMALIKVLVMMMLLCLTLVGVQAVLSATTSEKLVPQMGMVVVVVAMGLLKRKSIMANSERAVTQFANRMSGGGTGTAKLGWVGSAGVGAGAGVLASKVQHAAQVHGQNSRSRALVELTRDRNATEGTRVETLGRTANATEGTRENTARIYDLFADAAARTREQPYEPPRTRPSPRGPQPSPLDPPRDQPIPVESRDSTEREPASLPA